MTDKEQDQNTAPDVIHGMEAGAEEKDMRVKMGILVAELLMKIGFGEVTDEVAREELESIVSQWEGATETDIREAREEIEETLAYRKIQLEQPPALDS